MTNKQQGDSYHHGNLRKALLEEGLMLLEEHGEAGFSLRELARRVDVTPNAAYRHFINKEALLMGLAAEGFRVFDCGQKRVWRNTGGDAAEKFLAMGNNYVRFAQDQPALFGLMFGRFASENRTDEFENVSGTAFATLQQGVAAVLELPFDSETTRLTAYNAFAVVHGFSHLILDGQIHGTREDVEKLVESSLRHWISTSG